MKIKITTLPLLAAHAIVAAEGNFLVDLRPLQSAGKHGLDELDGRDPKAIAHYKESTPPNFIEAMKGIALMTGSLVIADPRGVRRSVATARMVAEVLVKEGHDVEIRDIALGDKPFNYEALMEAKKKADAANAAKDGLSEEPEEVKPKAKSWADLGIAAPGDFEVEHEAEAPKPEPEPASPEGPVIDEDPEASQEG
jgi:hypothetical protein